MEIRTLLKTRFSAGMDTLQVFSSSSRQKKNIFFVRDAIDSMHLSPTAELTPAGYIAVELGMFGFVLVNS